MDASILACLILAATVWRDSLPSEKPTLFKEATLENMAL